MAITNLTPNGFAYYSGGWVPSSGYSGTFTNYGYAGGGYVYVLKFAIPSVSGTTSGRSLKFKLPMLAAGSSTSSNLSYRITDAGHNSSNDVQGNVKLSGSFAVSGLGAGITDKTLTTAEAALPTGTYYLWLYSSSVITVGGKTPTITMDYVSTSTCTAPTTFTALPSIFFGSIKISWSGAESGIGNSIVSYLIQYCYSQDGSNWSDWENWKTVTTSKTYGEYSHSVNVANGYYVKFRIRTQGSAGSSYYSPYKTSAQARKYATACATPTLFTLTPTPFEKSVLISWSGAKAGTNNNITGYLIQSSVSQDNVNWGSYVTVSSINSTATSGKYTDTPDVNRGQYIKYRIQVLGSAGSDFYSSYKYSTSARKNSAPNVPTELLSSDDFPSLNDIITLSWVAPTDPDNDLLGYHIYCGEELLFSTATNSIDIKVTELMFSTTSETILSVAAYDSFDVQSEKVSISISRVDKDLNYMVSNGIRRMSMYADIGGTRRKISLYQDVAGERVRLLAPKMTVKTETTLTDSGQQVTFSTPVAGEIITGTVYAAAETAQTISILTDNQAAIIGKTMQGIRVASGENFTDSSGQKWLCDSYDLATQTLTKRVESGVAITAVTYSGAALDYPPQIFSTQPQTNMSVSAGEIYACVKVVSV